LARYDSMTVDETQPGHYVVTHDDSGEVIWEGAAYSNVDAYGSAERADHGSRCGWDDRALDEVRRILRRGGLTLGTDDVGLLAVAVSEQEDK
jgi:hypothetical protein